MASKKILIQVDLTTQSAEVKINKVVESLKQVEGATTKVTTATKKARTQSGLNNAILLETGRLASDASYGFTAIANNLSQVITLFQSFARTNGGFVNSLGLLIKQLFGPAGILIGIQLLISFGPKLLDMLTGMDKAAKAAAKAQEELNKQLNKLNANVFLLQSYVNVIEDVNTNEEKRKNLTQELINLVPELEAEDFKYGQNLDQVRRKIEDYALSQATRIEIDKLVEENSEVLATSAAVRRIQQITDEQTRVKEMTKFLEKQGMDVDARVRERRLTRTSLLESEAEAIEQIFLLSTTSALLASVEIEKTLEELYENIIARGGKATTREDKITKTRVENFDREISTIIRLGKIQNDFAQKRADLNAKEIKQEKLSFDERRTNLESEILQGQISIDLQEAQSLKELNQLEISEELKGQARLNIEKYYDDLRTKSTKENSEARNKIDNLERDAKLKTLDDIGRMIMSASDIAGKATGAGKALAIAGTLVSTYSSAQKAYESQLTATPDSPFRAVIAAAAAVASGLANVAAIRKVKTPTMKESSISGVGGATAIEAPDFNVVGASGTSQLATSLAGVTGRPIQAFVVSKQITSQQELDRNITNNASIN